MTDAYENGNFVTNEEDMLLKLNNLKINQSSGINNLHPQVLEEIKLKIKNFLTKFFNLSLTSRYLSIDWKLSTVTAKYKKGSKSEISNYRPILLMTIICKI